MEPYYDANGIRLLHGDCREVMAILPDGSFDSCVTDPPYGLEFMGKDWDAPWKGDLRQPGQDGFTCGTGPYGRAKVRHGGSAAYSSGLSAVHSFQAWCEAWAREVLRVLKPGAHLLAFGGTRTYHRLACAIEDAGFEIRDQIGWAFGQGFPKSHNLDGEWEGWGTALKPAWEPIVVARKPLVGTVAENMAAHRTGAMNIDGCRIEMSDSDAATIEAMGGFGAEGYKRKKTDETFMQGTPLATEAKAHPSGRWPANLIHDGSPEVLACFPDSKSCDSPSSAKPLGTILPGARSQGAIYPGEHGSAARFFYCAKADRTDRNEGCEKLKRKPLNWSSGEQSPGTFQAEGTDRTSPNHHPTVKPTDLMRYLCRLVTPPGGLILEPFLGSGTTAKAAYREGFRLVGIEREADYIAIAKARISYEADQHVLFANEAQP